MSAKTLLTAAQPTAALHLGNYLGAIQHWVRLAPQYRSYIFICDLHALTVLPQPAQLRAHTLEAAALYLACGLDPKHCALFVQSHVHGHTDLAWILACLCPLGELQRMTQFKDKSSTPSDGFVSSGLLYYPILQAADILIYNADIVPVGHDQKQHLELTRDMASRFNQRYSETFTLPTPYIPEQAGRIMSLQDPTRKMSKSDPNPAATLFLLDPPNTLRKKIRSAVTDSEARIAIGPEKPGITNLLSILASLKGIRLEEAMAPFASSYGPLKDAVADAVIEALTPIQTRYQAIIQDPQAIEAILTQGARQAQAQVDSMMERVRHKIGLK